MSDGSMSTEGGTPGAGVSLSERGDQLAFIRQSTGLVRLMGARQAMVYNAMITGVIVISGLTFIWVPYAFPGANIWLSFLISGLFAAPMIAAYSLLAVSMPRSGGDYLFQSRLLHPAIACALCLSGYVIWMAFWENLDGYFFSDYALSPVSAMVGTQEHAHWLISFSTWATTPWGLTVVSLVAFIPILALLIRGARLYLRIQPVLWFLTVLSFVVCWILLLSHGHSSFVSSFNAYVDRTSGVKGYYAKILAAAHKAGFQRTGMNIGDTFGAVAIIWTGIAWTMWSVVNAGEVKSAVRLRSVSLSMQGALGLNVVLLTITGVLFVHTVGLTFLQAVGYLFFVSPGGLSALPTIPFFGLITSVLSHSLIVLLLIGLGFVANGIQILFGVAWGGSRLILAMAFDRLLPERLGDVNPRTHTPVKALLFFFGMGTAWVLLYNHTVVAKYTLAVTLASIFVYLGTMCAAMVFPYRAPELFKRSPVARLKLLGIPLITAMGALGFILNAWIAYYYFADDKLFVNDTKSMVLVFGLVAICGVYYYIRRWWLNQQGYEPDVAYKMIPPE